jgi:hypothetical protein
MNTNPGGKQLQTTRRERWRDWIAKQAQSGLSVRAFCAQHGLKDQAFYWWRRQLHEALPVRFALVETSATQRPTPALLRLHLSSGERLEIAPGVDGATLRTVLAVLRERP